MLHSLKILKVSNDMNMDYKEKYRKMEKKLQTDMKKNWILELLLKFFFRVCDFFESTVFTGCAIKNWTHTLNYACSHNRNPSNFKTTIIYYYTELSFEVYNTFLGHPSLKPKTRMSREGAFY